MKKFLTVFLSVMIAYVLGSCDFIKNTFTYKDKTKELVDTLLKEDYDRTMTFFAMDHEMAKDINPEEMKRAFPGFRKKIVDGFGTELEYSLMKSEKKFSTEHRADDTPTNTTRAFIQFSNGKEFDVFTVLFDDVSGKILNINTLDVKQPIPSMGLFWLCGLIFFCVPVFNIYVIRQIKRSSEERKWLKYLMVAFLNTPSITYSAVGGFTIKAVNFQLLLGISFGYMGYLGSFWTIGIPLGGLFWFFMLRRKQNVTNAAPLASPFINDGSVKTQ